MIGGILVISDIHRLEETAFTIESFDKGVEGRRILHKSVILIVLRQLRYRSKDVHVYPP
jgi:hypothetical protein